MMSIGATIRIGTTAPSYPAPEMTRTMSGDKVNRRNTPGMPTRNRMRKALLTYVRNSSSFPSVSTALIRGSITVVKAEISAVTMVRILVADV